MSPNPREALQIHLHSTSNKIVLHGPALKRENTICKMTVCKKNGYNLQDENLQDASLEDDDLQDDSSQDEWVQFARYRYECSL